MIRQAKSAYGKFWSKKQLQSFALLCVHCWAIFLRTLALAFRSAAIQKIMKDCISQNCPKQKNKIVQQLMLIYVHLVDYLLVKNDASRKLKLGKREERRH